MPPTTRLFSILFYAYDFFKTNFHLSIFGKKTLVKYKTKGNEQQLMNHIDDI